jgi:hypothetical protein
MYISDNPRPKLRVLGGPTKYLLINVSEADPRIQFRQIVSASRILNFRTSRMDCTSERQRHNSQVAASTSTTQKHAKG